MLNSQHATEEAVLPQVPCPAPTSVAVLRIPTMYSTHQQAQRILSTGQQNQVNMIAHQTPRPHPDVRFVQILAQQTQIGKPIFIQRERGLAVYPAIRNSRKNTTRS